MIREEGRPDAPVRDVVDHGAFVPGPRLTRQGAAQGALAGMTLAVKDLFDVEGDVTGCGNPDRAQAPARQNAWAVQQLLDAGASIVGKTVTDEISLGLLGRNRHLGTPLNPVHQNRMPGGSSSGSGAAVAARQADLGLGSDSGGSVRVPASFLGLWGMRPTHGSISLEGLMTQSPSLDTVGMLARSASDLAKAMDVLLPEDSRSPSGLVIATDAVSELEPGLQRSFENILPQLEEVLGAADRVAIASPDGLDAWVEVLGVVQAAEFGATFAPWLEAADPRLSWSVARALVDAVRLSPQDVEGARLERQRIVDHVDGLLGPRWLCMPTVPTPAPLRGMPCSELSRTDRQLVRCLCVAGLTGRPEISMPLLTQDGLPVGVSLIGPPGSDKALLQAVAKIAARLN